MERTVLLLKPDALARGLIGEITSRLEKKGLQLVGCKMIRLDSSLLEIHYAHLINRPFYHRIADFMTSLPVIAQCWEGMDAVAVVRNLTGITNGREADIGTIRGDLSMSVQCNLVHASDSGEAAELEIKRFFAKSEIFPYEPLLLRLLYSVDEIDDSS